MIDIPYEYEILCRNDEERVRLGASHKRKGVLDLSKVIAFEETQYDDEHRTVAINVCIDKSWTTIIGNYEDFKKIMIDKGVLKK